MGGVTIPDPEGGLVLAHGDDGTGTPVKLRVDADGHLQVDVLSGGGGATQYAEDSVHMSGDMGNLMLVVRQDTAASLVDAAGDYAPLIVDANGRLHVDLSAIRKDDTDKLGISLYGKGSAAGDTPVDLENFVSGNMRVGLWDGGTHYGRNHNPADGQTVTNVLSTGAVLQLHNGQFWDRFKNNWTEIVVDVTNQTSTYTSSTKTNYNQRGAYIFFKVTSAPGVDTVQLVVQGQVPVAGDWIDVLTDTAVSATGLRTMLIYPGIGTVPGWVDQYVDAPLMRAWRVKVVHSGTGAFDYRVDVNYMN